MITSLPSDFKVKNEVLTLGIPSSLGISKRPGCVMYMMIKKRLCELNSGCKVIRSQHANRWICQQLGASQVMIPVSLKTLL